jgi:hypothetical protein
MIVYIPRMSIKAFDLVPAIERIKLMSDKAKTQVNIVIVVTVIENFKEYTRSEGNNMKPARP